MTGALMFVGFAALSAMLAFVSVAVIVPVAVYTWGEPLSACTVVERLVAGRPEFPFTVGRFLDRPMVTWLTADSRPAATGTLHTPCTSFRILVPLFQLALPSEIPGYVLGLMSYQPGPRTCYPWAWPSLLVAPSDHPSRRQFC